ncbi:MAG: hypothetical protein HY305_00205, partial [Sphingobacteriales bacterium]|nr:hypothetical protein [Sphingobacteriales bacterium]
MGNLANDAFKFKSNGLTDQAVYFKNPGEKVIADANFQKMVGDESLVRLKMTNTATGNPTLVPQIIKYDATKKYIGEQQIGGSRQRDKRTQVISFLTAYEAGLVGFDKDINSYRVDGAYANSVIFDGCPDITYGVEKFKRHTAYSNYNDGRADKGYNQDRETYRNLNHISEIDVLGSDGRKYVYGLPVYNTRQVDVSFSINNGDNNTGKSNYDPGTDDTKFNNKGRDNYMQQEEMPAYAHSFLLTALVSPNYVDVTQDGITEDDKGDAVKFNYTKFKKPAEDGVAQQKAGFQWRTPVGNKVASYSEGLKTDIKDDKAHYIYGEREMWHLYSIESKNMIARFYVKNDRRDCRQVTGQEGGLDPNWGMQRLDKVCLYSKADLIKLGADAKPIKTVQFFQSYKLCKNVDNNNGIPDYRGGCSGSTCKDYNTNHGKLTLDSIWIFYNGNKKTAKTRYVFSYPKNNNPAYDYNSNDRWGNYKPVKEVNGSTTTYTNPANLTNADYPYVIQDKTKADKYAAAWRASAAVPDINTVNKNSLYQYVRSPLGPGGDHVDEYAYIYIKLPHAVSTQDETKMKNELLARYFENRKELYMKLAVTMPSKPGIGGSEMIGVYADIEDIGLVKINNVLSNNIAYVKVPYATGGHTAMVQQALQFIRQQLPGKAYPGYDVSENSSSKAVIMALSAMIVSLGAMASGEDKTMQRANLCKNVEANKSFARLTNYDEKYGGGLRVKKVTISDNWNKMTGQYDAIYGQEYNYNTTELINGELATISSGVAAWEPSVGGDENPHREVMKYIDHNKGGPYNLGSIEVPLGETFYPSPTVGYSRVEVLSVNRTNVKNLPTRQVTEFYTTKDFPFKSSCTQLGDPEANVKYDPPKILQVLKIDMKKAVTQSQGFLVEMNDMNGKMKIQATYTATDPDHPVSYTENFYNVQKQSNNTYKFNHYFSTVNAPNGIVT